jgi:hypothetical protein
MKRGCKTSRSSDILTGGSGDVNPQILQIIQGQDFANALGSQGYVLTFPNPAWDLNRSIQLGCDKSKAFAMEVLGVWLMNDPPPLNSVTAAAITVSNVSTLSYDSAPAPAIPLGSGFVQSWEWVMDAVRGVPQNDTNIIAAVGDASSSATTPTGSPTAAGQVWDYTDLTDADGHGMLVGAAVFNIRTFIRFTVVPGFGGTFMTGCRIKYRIKAISYEDWVRQFTFGV